MSLPLPNDKTGDWGTQESLVAAMMQSSFYPKPPNEITHKETHISHLFFADELVYKVKKAVRYSFLDYSTLAKRRHYLNEELRLNRRLAPSVYLGVMPIAHDETGWRLGGWAEPAEYTLVMRRLPEKRMLPFLMETEQITPAMMGELADVLARFHREAEICKGIDPHRYLAAVRSQWDENLSDIQSFIATSLDRFTYDAIQRFGADFIRTQADRIMKRAKEGWIRDVHGDLHCEHVCFAPEGIQIFDCIEFSPKLRRCDLASELAFLAMDLEVRGGASLVEPFLAHYRELIEDPDLPILLPFGKCYRALVRAKVQALRTNRWNEQAAGYFRYAGRLTWEGFKPFLVLVCGLSGSGKSTLARELGERLGLAVINSDAVRKQLAGRWGRHLVPVNEGIYSTSMTEQTYAKMARAAEKQITSGRGAILDATFVRRIHRDRIARLADKHKIPLLVIHCSASESITASRLAQRAAEGVDVSDGRWEIYVAQKAANEPIADFVPNRRLDLNTDAPLEQLVIHCETFLRGHLNR